MPRRELAKANLARAIRDRIREYGLNQTQAADRLGTTQARVSDLMNGKISKMSYELLLGYLNVLDCDVRITIVPRPMLKPVVTTREEADVSSHGHILVGTG